MKDRIIRNVSAWVSRRSGRIGSLGVKQLESQLRVSGRVWRRYWELLNTGEGSRRG